MSLIEYNVDGALGLITLNRPEASNAQNEALLDELDAAWRAAERDDAVKVIVLNANGKHFSGGHDLAVTKEQRSFSFEQDRGIKEGYRWEHDKYFGYCRRWRDVPKPSIAAVQGACIAAGLMLCWPCDLIMASEDAYFSDPVLRLGIAGVEYHGHTWEWGSRRAKEMLFTGRKMTAQEAFEVGMVNRVVPRDHLQDATLTLAREIAEMDAYGLAQSKRAVNLTLDIIGQHAALQSVYDIHWLGHSNALVATGNDRYILTDLEAMKAANKDS